MNNTSFQNVTVGLCHM